MYPHKATPNSVAPISNLKKNEMKLVLRRRSKFGGTNELF